MGDMNVIWRSDKKYVHGRDCTGLTKFWLSSAKHQQRGKKFKYDNLLVAMAD